MEAGIEQLGTWITGSQRLTVERKVTDKQEEEVRMIHVAMHLRQRRQSVLAQ